jgi:hypothetical protein
MATTQPSITADQDSKVQHVSHLENGQHSDDEKRSLEDDPLHYFTPEEQKKIIHRLDRRLVVVVVRDRRVGPRMMSETPS